MITDEMVEAACKHKYGFCSPTLLVDIRGTLEAAEAVRPEGVDQKLAAAKLMREAAKVLCNAEVAGLDVQSIEGWRWPLLDELVGMAGIIETDVALRPKMVEVGVVGLSDGGYIIGELYDLKPNLGTKLYAEQPKPSGPNNHVDSFGATTV